MDILTRSDATARAQQVSNVRIATTVDVSDQSQKDDFGVSSTLTFDATGNDVFVDAHATLITRVVLNGREVSNDELSKMVADHRVYLTGLVNGENVVEIEGRFPYSNAGVGLHRFEDPTDGQVFLYTQFEPFEAHRMYPCFDQPDLKIRWDLTVNAPAGWEVISNSEHIARPDQDSATQMPGAGEWRFAQTPPISPYITALIAGPYVKVTDKHGDIDLGIYCRPSLAKHLDADEIFEITKAGLDWFAKAFAQPYPFGKYDQLFCPQFNFGAMENPGAVTFTERYIFRNAVTDAMRAQRANTILHEMAHMWFGDLVTMQWWDDLWLNESFATFIASTALAEATRFGALSWSEFALGEKAWAYAEDQLPTTHPISTDASDTHIVMANFDGITYAKGSSVVKQLFSWVGREAFFSGLATYFETYAWQNANLKQFLAELEKTSGRDLQTWADAWLLTTGPDLLEVKEGGRVIARTQGLAEREHQILIGLFDQADDGQLIAREPVSVEITGEGFTFDEAYWDAHPTPALVVPNDQDLTYARVYLDTAGVAAVTEHLHTIEDQVTRAVVWGSLWQMTRDGVLPVHTFIKIIEHNLPFEADVNTQNRVMAQAITAAERFLDGDVSSEARRQLCRLATVQMEKAEPGSDQMLNWATLRIDARRDVPWLTGIVQGDEQIPGIELTGDLRWRAVKALAAMGLIDADGLRAERDRDPNDAGKIAFEGALALLPTAKAKEAAFTRGMDTSLPLHYRREILNNFWDVLPEVADGLVDPWLDQWTTLLPEIWKDSSAEASLQLTEAVYPGPVVDQRVVDRAAAALDALELPASAQRALKEGIDNTTRALGVRAAQPKA
ncbi:aminopeptidase N [Stomatohabitans albus]|uniref:aminopeptidase N n=1 Tax=Stomatohabitans albus TaxID=3110766 RepID=UPI00300C89BD